MLTFWIAVLPPILFTCALLYVLPNLSRSTYLFAVTVPPSFRSTREGRAIIRNYRRLLMLCYLGGLVGAALFAASGKLTLLPLPLFAFPIGGALAGVALCHRAALRYAAPAGHVRVASLAPRAPSLSGSLWGWAGPFAILAGAAGYLSVRWDEIPARFPIHWSLNGGPNGWGERTFAGVYGVLAIAAVICLFLFVSAWLMGSRSRGSVASRRMTRRMLLGVAYGLAGLFAWIGIRFPFAQAEPGALAIAIMVGVIPVAILAVVFYNNYAKEEPEPESDAPDRAQSYLGIDDPGANAADANWKAGLFYFAPEDPALFIEKRIGIGYDLNFGNPLAWVLLGFVLLIPAAVLIFGK